MQEEVFTLAGNTTLISVLWECQAFILHHCSTKQNISLCIYDMSSFLSSEMLTKVFEKVSSFVFEHTPPIPLILQQWILKKQKTFSASAFLFIL